MDTYLSPEELRQAAEVRSLMIIELQHLPVFIENKYDLITAELRQVVTRYLNAIAETLWELTDLVHDLALVEMSARFLGR